MEELPTIIFCNILCAFVCQDQTCLCVVTIEMLKQHLARKHRFKIEFAGRVAEILIQRTKGANPQKIASRYFNDPFPKLGERPLPALPLLPIYDVIQCPSCKLYFNGIRSCTTHVRSMHKVQNQRENILQQLNDSSSVKGQSLFVGPCKLFFPVSCDISHGSVRDPMLPRILPSADNLPGGRSALSDSISLREKSANLTCSILGIPAFLDSQGLTLQKAYEMSKVEQGLHSRIVNVMLEYISHFANKQPAVPLAIIEGVRIRTGNNVASFSLSIEKRSKRRYSGVAARFLQLIANLDSFPLPNFTVSEGIRNAGKRLMLNLLETGSAQLPLVHEFFSALLLQEPRASLGESVMLESLFKLLIAGYTCATQSKRVRVGDAEDASHTAASMQYFCHLAALGEYFVSPIGFGCETDEDEGSRLRHIQEKLSTSKCTPAAYLRTILQKTKRLSPGESPRLDFIPCPNHELCGTVENIEVQMNSDRAGSLGYTVRKIREDVRQALRNDLMRNFELPADFSMKVLSFPDKLSKRDPGYFFGEGDLAQEYLRSSAEAFARHLSIGPKPLIISCGSGSEKKWIPTRHASVWLKTVDKLSILLYTLIHLSGGGPPRVTELVEAKLRNTAGSRRNLFIIKQRISIIVSYSKTVRQTQKPKPIARFLDDITSEILLQFLVFIKPVQCFFLNSSLLKVRATEDYIFCRSGEKLSDELVCKGFSKALSTRGLPLNVSLYRQLRTGVAKAFLSESIGSTNEELLFLQAGHTESTARNRYAGGDFNVDELSIAKLEGFYTISRKWHEVIGIHGKSATRDQSFAKANEILGLSQTPSARATRGQERVRGDPSRSHGLSSPSSGSRKRAAPVARISPADKRVKHNECEETNNAERKQSMTDLIISCARDIVPISAEKSLKFKSEAQRAATFDCALQTIVTGYSSTMIVILPTGGGKTLCWATAALREQRSSDTHQTKAPITLLILPLISLQQDMVRKCRSSGLRCGLWEERFQKGITVVICSIDVVFTRDYERFLIALSVQQRVARIVLDEAHLAVLWEKLRRFDQLGIRLRPAEARFVPLVCLTATLPNVMLGELQRVLQLDGSCVKLYRELSSRKNISYQVRRVKAVRSEQMIEFCSLLLQKEIAHMTPTDRVIVFCLTINDCVMMHKAFVVESSHYGTCIYHGSMTHEERLESFNSWIHATSKHPMIMIATSAFSCGIDFPHVRLVLHAGGSRTIVELAQESGRAGRDGAAAKNIVLFDPEYILCRTDKSCSTAGKPGTRSCFGDINSVLDQNTICRRQVIESFLNDLARGPCKSTEIRCDVCERWIGSVDSVSGSGCTVSQDSESLVVRNSLVLNRKRVEAYSGTSCDISGRKDVELIQKRKGNKPPLLSMLSMQLGKCVQHHDMQTSWYAEQLSLAQCALCLFHRNKASNHASCMYARCFRCLEPSASHQSKDCKVTPRGCGMMKRCFFCGIPKSKGLHQNGSYDKRGKCEWEVAKNLALLIWRDKERRPALIQQIPELRNSRNIQEVGHLLCGGQKQEEETLLTKALEYMYSTFVLGSL